MKTTWNVPDPLMKRLKQEAARRGVTMSELVEAALRALLDPRRPDEGDLPELPAFDCGRLLVDVSDRDALYDALAAER